MKTLRGLAASALPEARDDVHQDREDEEKEEQPFKSGADLKDFVEVFAEFAALLDDL